VNDAMVSVFSPVREMTAEEYRRVTEVNYLGTVYGTLAALRHMRRVGEGTIIQIGSALVYRSIPLQSAYCASKAAIRGFTDSLRCELAHEKSRIRVSMLQLPAVNTPQFDVVRTRLPRHPKPVPPIYQPEVIAQAVLRVAERPVRELWLAPSALKAIVGQRIETVLTHADGREIPVEWAPEEIVQKGRLLAEARPHRPVRKPPPRPKNSPAPITYGRGKRKSRRR